MVSGRLKTVKLTAKFSFMEEINQSHKVSIRFFNNKEVRATWDNAGNR